jgi:hypothetical protein
LIQPLGAGQRNLDSKKSEKNIQYSSHVKTRKGAKGSNKREKEGKINTEITTVGINCSNAARNQTHSSF